MQAIRSVIGKVMTPMMRNEWLFFAAIAAISGIQTVLGFAACANVETAKDTKRFPVAQAILVFSLITPPLQCM